MLSKGSFPKGPAAPSWMLRGTGQAGHPSSVAMDVFCICGAPYERTEKIVSVRDFNSAICEFCGTGLAMWCSSRIPVYRLKQRAQDKKPLP